MNDLFGNVNDMWSVGLLLLLVYAQVNYYMSTYMKKIVEDSQSVRQKVLMMTRENNSVLDCVRNDLIVESKRIQALQERLESLESTFKQLASAESALLNETISHLRVKEVSTWKKKARAKIQKQIDDASRRNTLLENAATWQTVPNEQSQ
jgi:hypothetical protein